MNYDFYDDMSIMNGYMPFNENLNSNQNNYDNQPYNNFNSNNPINDNNLVLYDPYEGYLKGNAFKDEYMPYKDYKVLKLAINNEKDDLLIGIGQYSFMMHDLNLFLDVHPNDQEALRKFSEYRSKANELITRYERKYGPLSVKGDVNNNTPFNWTTTNWPWVN